MKKKDRRKRNRSDSEETEEIKHSPPPLTLTCYKDSRPCPIVSHFSWTPRWHKMHDTITTPNHPQHGWHVCGRFAPLCTEILLPKLTEIHVHAIIKLPLGWQTTEGSPGRTWQAWGGSFLSLLRRHALSSRWLWTFNHNTCENCLEEVQGSATSSLFMPPLFQNMWPCVQLFCAKHNAPLQQDLAIDKAKPPASAAKWQGNDQTDLQCQTARHCHHQVQWATCVA